MRDTGRIGRWLAQAGLAAALGLAAACAAQAPYVWVDRLPASTEPESGEYRISPGDVISISVWNQDSISVPRAKVRDDGKISVAFLNDVEVQGMTPNELATRLQARLKAFIVNPVVTVRVEDVRPIRVSVVGQVGQPGTYDLGQGSGVLHAIAVAHGISDFAKRDGIYVLRHGLFGDGNPAPTRIRFRYQALTRGDARASAFKLRDRDVVVVE